MNAFPVSFGFFGERPIRVAGGLRRMTSVGDKNCANPAADFSGMIVAIAATADRESFARLYRHFAPRVRGYLGKLGTSPNLAEDITQETMLAVWRKAASFDPSRAGASTWIFTIARNLRIDHGRRNARPIEQRIDPSDVPETPSPPDALMMSSESGQRVQQAIRALPPEQAEIVKLFYFNEMPHSEIAAVLKLPLGTVKSRVRLALGRLRGVLDDLR